MALSKELVRIATFRSWPSTSRMCSLKLAKCGFYYKGRGDEVECFQCKTRIDGWNAGDNADERHRQVAPHCRLLNGKFTGNVPTDCSLRANVEIQSNQVEHDESTGALTAMQRQAASRAKKNGVVFKIIDRTRPDYGVLQSEAERRSTFYDWPQNANADPDALAQAGFYYTGTGDRVQCFRCKVVVSSWERSDVPISEHRRLFPNCPFACGLSNPNVNEDNSGQSAVQQHQTSIAYSLASGQPALIPERAIAVERAALTPEQIEREVEVQLDTPTVRAVLAMGYSRNDVKAVIETRLSAAGENFPDVNSLLDALLLLEETTTSEPSGATASSSTSEEVNDSACSIDEDLLQAVIQHLDEATGSDLPSGIENRDSDEICLTEESTEDGGNQKLTTKSHLMNAQYQVSHL